MKRALAILLLAVPVWLFGQTAEKDGITKAIGQGSSTQVAKYFASTVDLMMLETEDVYSSKQAEVILTNFFSENKPTSFELKHEGKSKVDDYYYIGVLTSGSKTYRITFFLKKGGESFQIKQLRIEKG